MLTNRTTSAPTILVVEDDPETREFYTDFLKWHAYHPVIASSGQMAFRTVTTQPLDGIVLDRRLPDMDGLVVCRRIRDQLGSKVPIIVISADGERGLEAAAYAAGANAFLAKPFELQILSRWLEKFVSREIELIEPDTEASG